MIQEINNNLIKASDLINNKKFDEAENVLKEYIQQVQPLINQKTKLVFVLIMWLNFTYIPNYINRLKMWHWLVIK